MDADAEDDIPDGFDFMLMTFPMPLHLDEFLESGSLELPIDEPTSSETLMVRQMDDLGKKRRRLGQL